MIHSPIRPARVFRAKTPTEAAFARCLRIERAIWVSVVRAPGSLESGWLDFFSMGGGSLFGLGAALAIMSACLGAQLFLFPAAGFFIALGAMSQRQWMRARKAERRSLWKAALSKSQEPLNWAAIALPAEDKDEFRGIPLAQAHARLAAEAQCLREAIAIEREVKRASVAGRKGGGQKSAREMSVPGIPEAPQAASRRKPVRL